MNQFYIPNLGQRIARQRMTTDICCWKPSPDKENIVLSVLGYIISLSSIVLFILIIAIC